MLPEYRRPFNERYTPERYARFIARLHERCGVPVAFRNSETPCFFPPWLIQQMADAGAEMSMQLVNDPKYVEAADRFIPPEFRAADPTDKPLFVQADFGLIRNDAGDLEPRLVEIQGFPSLYAYQIELAETYAEAYELPSELTPLLGGRSVEQYHRLVRSALLNGHAPENVVLLEIEPTKQKTLADFLLTERTCGISTVNVTDIQQDGRDLLYKRDGRTIPIHRIYNRVIIDELIRKHIQLNFNWTDNLNVEWAGHPDWFFRISKFSLPYLNHPFVPKSEFLNDVEELPAPPEELVLKPLFSFAGMGVIVGPTAAEIAAIENRDQYLLQERVRFEPTVETPFGLTNTEVRIMYVWSGERPEAVTTIVRMGRGKMMGVDHNRDLEWVGASAGFIPKGVVT